MLEPRVGSLPYSEGHGWTQVRQEHERIKEMSVRCSERLSRLLESSEQLLKCQRLTFSEIFYPLHYLNLFWSHAVHPSLAFH